MQTVDRCVLPSSLVDATEFFQPYDNWSPFVIDGDPESSVGTAIWRAGITKKQLWSEAQYTEQRALRFYRRLHQRLAWAPAEIWGERLFLQLVERARNEDWFISALALWPAAEKDTLACAAYAYARVIDVICERRYVMHDGDELASIAPPERLRKLLGDDARKCRNAAMNTLRRLGEPVDHWHCETVVARMLCPRLALFAIGMPFWLSEPPPGQTALERQAATAVGSRDITERLAVTMKKDAQRYLGHQTDGERPGPKRGSRKTKSSGRQQLEDYVVARNRFGVTAR